MIEKSFLPSIKTKINTIKLAQKKFIKMDERTPLTSSKLHTVKNNPIVTSFLKAKTWYQSERLRKLRRWAALIVGSVMMIAAGTQYAFSSIGPSIKQ